MVMGMTHPRSAGGGRDTDARFHPGMKCPIDRLLEKDAMMFLTNDPAFQKVRATLSAIDGSVISEDVGKDYEFYNHCDWLSYKPYIRSTDPVSKTTIGIEGSAVAGQKYFINITFHDKGRCETYFNNPGIAEQILQKYVKIQQLCKAICSLNDCYTSHVRWHNTAGNEMDIVFTPNSRIMSTYSFRVIFDMLDWGQPQVSVKFFEKFRVSRTTNPTLSDDQRFDSLDAAAESIHQRLAVGSHMTNLLALEACVDRLILV
jgi:hypothetical protein